MLTTCVVTNRIQIKPCTFAHQICAYTYRDTYIHIYIRFGHPAPFSFVWMIVGWFLTMAASGKLVPVTWTLSLAVCLYVCGLVPLPPSLSLSLFVLFVCWGGEGETRIFGVYLLVQTGVNHIPLEGLTILPCFL